MKRKINYVGLLIVFGISTVFAKSPESTLTRAETNFFRQFAQLQEAENNLLRTYNSYLMSHCTGGGDEALNNFGGDNSQQLSPRPLGPRDFHIVPPGPTREPQQPSPRPLGPRDFHIVPPGPTGQPQQPSHRPLGPRDFHIVPPGPTGQPQQEHRSLGPRNFHIVPPGPTRDYAHVLPTVPPHLLDNPPTNTPPRGRPLGPRDFHIVPPGPTLDPTLRRSSFGPQNRQIVPPGPGMNIPDIMRPKGSDDFAGCGRCIPGLPGLKGDRGIPGLPGMITAVPITTNYITELMIKRGAILCEHRYQCKS